MRRLPFALIFCLPMALSICACGDTDDAPTVEDTTEANDTTSNQDTNVEPDDTNVEPDDTNVEPDDTNVEPDDTNVEPDDTNVEPDDTNVEPDDTNVEPDDTNVEPDDWWLRWHSLVRAIPEKARPDERTCPQTDPPEELATIQDDGPVFAAQSRTGTTKPGRVYAFRYSIGSNESVREHSSQRYLRKTGQVPMNTTPVEVTTNQWTEPCCLIDLCPSDSLFFRKLGRTIL